MQSNISLRVGGLQPGFYISLSNQCPSSWSFLRLQIVPHCSPHQTSTVLLHPSHSWLSVLPLFLKHPLHYVKLQCLQRTLCMFIAVAVNFLISVLSAFSIRNFSFFSFFFYKRSIGFPCTMI